MGGDTAKDRAWFKKRCENGCQMCGARIPDLGNNGLKFSHIMSKGSSGGNKEKNILALCHHCEHAFDKMLKPALYTALTEFNEGKVPENWGGEKVKR